MTRSLQQGFALMFFLLVFSCTEKPSTPKPDNQPSPSQLVRLDSLIFQHMTEPAYTRLGNDIIKRNELQKNIDPKVYCAWNFRLYDSLAAHGRQAIFPMDGERLHQQAMATGDTSLIKKANGFLYELGMYQNGESRYLLARRLFERYLSLPPAQQTLVTPTNLYVKGALGEIYLRLGDYKKAVSMLSDVYDYFSPLPVRQQIPSIYIAIANAKNETKEYAAAIHYAQQGLDRTNPDTLSMGDLKTVMVESFLGSKNYAAAEKMAIEVNELFGNNPNISTENRFASLTTYADVLQKSARYAEAIQRYHLAANKGRQTLEGDKTREFSKLYISLGSCFQSMHRLDSAQYYYHKALASVVKIDPLDVDALPQEKNLYTENAIQEALDALAGCWLETRSDMDNKHALQALALAMKVDELLQQQFSFEVAKLGYQQQKKSRSVSAIGICQQLFKKDGNQDWIRQAWEFSEAAKAAVLQDDIRQQMAYRQHATDPIIEQLAYVRQQQSDLKKSIFENTDPARTTLLDARMDSLDREYVQLTTRLNPINEKLLAKEQHIDFIHHPLFENMPVVEFFSADSGFYYIFSKDISGRLALDTCTLADALVTDWLAFFAGPENCNNDPVRFKQMAHGIYTRLLQRFLKNEKPNALLLVPDGKLWYLPWDALVTGPAANTNWQQTPFFVRSTAVALGFSLESLVQQDSRPRQATTLPMVAFAPAFMHGERGQQPLASSIQELQGIKNTLPNGRYFIGQQATLRKFRESIHQADVLHLSTHASSGASEVACKLQLFDSAMYLHELYPLQVNATTVVLSACETGLGKFEDGEGVFSMARGFYFAGAKNVITSLWKVDDQGTADLFKSFYMQQTGAPFQKLHQAKLDYLLQHKGGDASPYYWSAFVDTGYTQPSALKHHRWWLWATLGLAAAISIFLMMKKKKAGTTLIN